MSSLLLRGCRLVATVDEAAQELPGASIGIRDGWIEYVGHEPSGTWDETLDCTRFLAIPGLVNTHHHLYQTLTRASPQSGGQGLFAWLESLYPVWSGLDEGMIFASTVGGLAELALSGCTTTADHLYVFPPGSEGFIDAQVEAARHVGVRFHPTRGSMDLGRSAGGLPPDSVVQDRHTILRDSERVIGKYHDPSPGSMVRVGLAPCSPFSVTPELMLESAGLARDEGVRLHTHIAETLDEDRYSREKFGMSPVGLLQHLGWVSDDVWLAHCVHLSGEDIGAIAANGAGVAHCPTSNMLLASGLAPVRALLDSGAVVGLGVDGSASNDSNDLRQEVKQAVLAARVRDGTGAMSVRDALRLATRGGAACLGRDDIGSIEPGRAADIVLFDTTTIETAGGSRDLVAAVVLGAPRPHTVIVHGRRVVERYVLQTCDADEAADALDRESRRLWQKAQDVVT